MRVSGELGRICDNVGRDKLIGAPGDDDLRANECIGPTDCQEATNISLGTRQRGGPGNDKLLGAERRDVLRGGRGNDSAQGFLGRDKVNGGPGDDTLDGGGGRDRVNGFGGNDQIEARDGKRDRIRCGKGRDSAMVDSKDRVRGCEQVVRRRLAGRLRDRLGRARGRLLDPVEDARPHAARQVVAHAVDQVEARARDRARGRAPARGRTSRSALPWITSVGTRIRFRSCGAMAARDDRAELAREAGRVDAAVPADAGELAQLVVVALERPASRRA